MTVHGEVRAWQTISTVAIIALAVAGTTLGLFYEGLYTDPEILLHQAYGQDTVTLLAVVPLLAIGLGLARRGSLRGYILWLGGLGYMAYTYAVYAVITQFNEFFLGYVALFGLSSFTLAAGVLEIDPDVVKERLEERLPVKAVVGFFVGMSTLISLLWLSEILPATLADEPPPSIEGTGVPANVVHVLDLGVLIPAMFVTGYWLYNGRPWGYVLSGVFFVKLTSIGVAVLTMIVWMHFEGYSVRIAEILIFTILTVLNATFAIVYYWAIR